MKTILAFHLALLVSAITFAQGGINYKALIKDSNGDIVANQAITVQFQILEDGTTNVFQETHNPTTDTNGLIELSIGEGTVDTGTFSGIDWSSDDYFLNVQVNIGNGLVDLGTSQFGAVPYAKVAEKALSVPLSNFKYPDGLEDIIPIYFGPNSPDYTVPTNKNLYITHIYNLEGGNINFINNNNVVAFSGIESANNNQSLTQPLIAGSGETINFAVAFTFAATGFLVDAKVNAIKSPGTNYTVPPNKILVITNTRSNILLNNNSIYIGSGASASNNTTSFLNPIIVNEAQVVGGSTWTGYLLDKN